MDDFARLGWEQGIYLAMSSGTTLQARAMARAQTTHIPLHDVHSTRSSITVPFEGTEYPGLNPLASRVQPVANGFAARTPCPSGDLDRRVDEDRHIPFPKRQSPQGLELDLSKVGNRLSAGCLIVA